MSEDLKMAEVSSRKNSESERAGEREQEAPLQIKITTNSSQSPDSNFEEFKVMVKR